MTSPTATSPIAIFVGTRPEVIKMAPVCRGLIHHDVPFRLFALEQQRDLLAQHIAEEGLDATPFEVTQGSLNTLLTGIVTLVDRIVEANKPLIALVHGDTTTALGAAIACFHQQIKVGHVEAGLRTCDPFSPFPEEANRSMIGAIATYQFAPTTNSLRYIPDHLHGSTRYQGPHVFLTGNTGIDAFHRALTRPMPQIATELLEKCQGNPFALVTCHRREHWGLPLKHLIRAITALPPDRHVIWPLHPNPRISDPVRAICAGKPTIHLSDPLPYEAMAHLVTRAGVVATDSGGLTEEATEAERPLIVLRSSTERPEAYDDGCRLVPLSYGPTGISEQITEAFGWVRRSKGRFGNGTAGLRIASILKRILAGTPIDHIDQGFDP